jgi:hypothetical protein
MLSQKQVLLSFDLIQSGINSEALNVRNRAKFEECNWSVISFTSRHIEDRHGRPHALMRKVEGEE